MKQKFSELDVFVQLDNKHADAAFLVLSDGCTVSKVSIDTCVSEIGACFFKELDRLATGSHVRIMVLTEEREVSDD